MTQHFITQLTAVTPQSDQMLLNSNKIYGASENCNQGYNCLNIMHQTPLFENML